MRWFWVLIGLLGVGAVVVVMTGGDRIAVDVAAGTHEPAARMGPITAMGVQSASQDVEIEVADSEVVNESEAVAGVADSQERDTDKEESSGGDIDVEVMSDGSLMLAGRYRVTGRGTPDEPYTVNWALLKSAEEGYAPIMGKTEIPVWIEMLGGMHVRIEGFMMNPTLEAEVGEFLLMKNSWDACCLGLPPTPYDSMEVALGEIAKMPELKHARASVTGRLGVSPSLVAGRFLTGLYTLDDARAEFRAGL